MNIDLVIGKGNGKSRNSISLKKNWSLAVMKLAVLSFINLA